MANAWVQDDEKPVYGEDVQEGDRVVYRSEGGGGTGSKRWLAHVCGKRWDAANKRDELLLRTDSGKVETMKLAPGQWVRVVTAPKTIGEEI